VTLFLGLFVALSFWSPGPASVKERTGYVLHILTTAAVLILNPILIYVILHGYSSRKVLILVSRM
jgi:hypothetical protein